MSLHQTIDMRSARPAVDAAFVQILEAEDLHPVFQPIVDLERRHILGYEALIRGPKDSDLEMPDALFAAASRLGLQAQLELVCRRLSIQHFAALGLDARLFLNVSPAALLAPDFRQGETLKYLQAFGVNPARIVIELTEHEPMTGLPNLVATLRHYRDQGFKVALDDLGAGYASLRLWTELLPDYIKIDKHFIQGLDTDRVKASFLGSLCRMAAATDCRLIAEGVERPEELEAVRRIGIALGQGYLFARPQAEPPRDIPDTVFQTDRPASELPRNGDLCRIARRVEPLGADVKVKQVVDYLQQRPAQQLLPIVDQGRPVGLINRHLFFNTLMATRFGVDLYGKSPISRLLDDNLIVVDIHADLETVSKRITGTPVPEQAFIITDGARYHGVASVLDLLEVITEQKVQNAMHANPLTLLPGLVPMNHHINAALAARQQFCVLYFDLDNFKPYNDCYGYAAGDGLIQLLAGLLRECYVEPGAHVGHIGGDDFIVVDYASAAEARVIALLEAFAAAVPAHYSDDHVRQGGIEGVDRQGRSNFFGLVSVSVGMVPPEAVRSCVSHIDVADLASEAKKLAKGSQGNSYFINRRSMRADRED